MKGLIKHLEGGLQKRNIYEDCRGQTVAIDTHVWLHEIGRRHVDAWRRGQWVPIVDEVTQRAAHLLKRGIATVFVFDGAPVPAKQATHDARAKHRAKAVESFYGDEDCDGPKGGRARPPALSVTWDLVSASIDALRAKGFTYYVAPYEGDGQLAHLSLQGIVDAVFTVDTDLVVLGCARTYLKVNYYTGFAFLADQGKLPAPVPDDKSGSLNLRELMTLHGALDVLRTYAVLAGCDYDTGGARVGPALALDLINEFGTDLQDIVEGWHQAPDDWLDRLRNGVECFVNPVVYHVASEKQRCLTSGRPPGVNKHLGETCPDKQALDRALGLITPSSSFRGDLVRVERQPVETVATYGLDPTYLEFHMVKGAVLPFGDPHGDTRSDPPRAPSDVDEKDVARNTVQALTRWLRTRGHPKPPGAKQQKLAKYVCAHLRNEKQSIEKGEVVIIRDPDGGSLHRYLQQRGKIFPQLDPAYDAPPRDSPGWVTDMKDICRDCPIVERSVMLWFYQVKNDAKEPKVMQDSYRRMVNRAAFPSLRFHDAAISLPDGDARNGLCWVQCCIPASMKPIEYAVSIALRYAEAGEGNPRFVYDVVSVRCGCVASAAGEYAYCVHGATLLWILNNLPREDETAKRFVPATSVACRWNKPNLHGEAYDYMKPAAYMPITKDEAGKAVKRNSAARAESAARVKFEAHAPGDLANNDPTKQTRVDAMKVLCDILTKDLGGKCAYEIQYLPQDEP